MMKTPSFLVRSYNLILVFAIAFYPGVSQAKPSDEQNRIILLNDSAAALEDTNPGLSRSLTEFADEKDKEWEAGKNAGTAPLTPVTGINSKKNQDRIKLLKAAALAIQPTYPLIAKSLNKMAKDMNGTIEVKK